ncbi:MAG: GNAT family N-acetyltransferase [Anaerolineae bacterium]|nr:GNAT family N-acetyltransferase [Anaerolineae bacterium]
MVAVHLKPITVENWKACIRLSVTAEQFDFVPDNLYSIAEAQFYPDACPRAIYNDADQIVGFILSGRDADNRRWKIFRLMIDAAFQGQGYGRAAMQQTLDELAAKPDGGEILVCYQDANRVARRLYASLGFVEQSVDAQGKATALWTRPASKVGP